MMQGRLHTTLLANRRGMVLITSYLAIGVFLVLQTAYIGRVVTDCQLSRRYLDRMRALHISEAGVDAAIARLRDLATYAGTPPTALGEGSFTTTVAPTGFTQTTQQLLESTHVRIQSQGSYPAAAPAETRALADIVNLHANPFTYALFSKTSMNVAGSVTVRAYDSRDPGPPGAWGRIGTNAVGADSIRVTGTTDTAGADLLCGSGCNTAPDTDINLIGPEFIGARRAVPEPKRLPEPNLSWWTSEYPNEGTLVILPGHTHTLSAGNHTFATVIMGDHSTLRSDGPVMLVTLRPPALGARSTIGDAALGPTNFTWVMSDPAGAESSFTFPRLNVIATIYVFSKFEASSIVNIIGGEFRGSLLMNVSSVNISGSPTLYYDYALSGLPVGADQLPREFQVRQQAWTRE